MGGGWVQQETAQPTSLEICAGAGGQALGLHLAGFAHRALVEWDADAVRTLRANVKKWDGWDSERVEKLRPLDVKEYLKSPEFAELSLAPGELDLLAGGVPCPPFSMAGKRLGADDERDLFPAMLDIVERLRPRAVMIENVRGLLEPPDLFVSYRRQIINRLCDLGYDVPRIDAAWAVEKQNEVMSQVWRRVDAYSFGVPQLRPRAILVAIHRDVPGSGDFLWPKRLKDGIRSVFDALDASMHRRCESFWDKNVDGKRAAAGELTGRKIYSEWKRAAQRAVEHDPDALAPGVAPTLVGGSKKHGGADLGPTRAKRAWKALGIDAMGVANDIDECVAERDLFRPNGPMLTVAQAAIIQGFPEEWDFRGKKTARYRQVGNAFPPPVAEAVGRAIYAVLRPTQREELLRKYEMDAVAAPLETSGELQLSAFPVASLGQFDPASEDLGHDFVGA